MCDLPEGEVQRVEERTQRARSPACEPGPRRTEQPTQRVLEEAAEKPAGAYAGEEKRMVRIVAWERRGLQWGSP